MNIKAFASNLIPFIKGPSESRATQAKLDANNDKEGNGQSSEGEQQQKRKLTPEEIQEAIKHLESLAGVKENNLTVRLSVEGDGEINIVYIEDRDGKIVRRIPESELTLLNPAAPPRKNGNILNRAG